MKISEYKPATAHSQTVILNNSEITLTTSASDMQSNFFVENVIPLVSIVIAGLAFFVSWRVMYLTRKHNKLALKPYLIFRVDTNHLKGKVKLYIANKGLGPCIFDDFEIKYKGNGYKQMSDVFNHIMGEFNYTLKDFDSTYRVFVYPLKGYALTPNEEKTLVKYQLKEKGKSVNLKFYESIKKIEFNYKHRDYYDQTLSKSFQYSRDFHNDSENKEE